MSWTSNSTTPEQSPCTSPRRTCTPSSSSYNYKPTESKTSLMDRGLAVSMSTCQNPKINSTTPTPPICYECSDVKKTKKTKKKKNVCDRYPPNSIFKSRYKLVYKVGIVHYNTRIRFPDMSTVRKYVSEICQFDIEAFSVRECFSHILNILTPHERFLFYSSAYNSRYGLIIYHPDSGRNQFFNLIIDEMIDETSDLLMNIIQCIFIPHFFRNNNLLPLTFHPIKCNITKAHVYMPIFVPASSMLTSYERSLMFEF